MAHRWANVLALLTFLVGCASTPVAGPTVPLPTATAPPVAVGSPSATPIAPTSSPTPINPTDTPPPSPSAEATSVPTAVPTESPTAIPTPSPLATAMSTVALQAAPTRITT